MPAKTHISPAPDESPERFVDGYLAYLLARTSQLVSQEFEQELTKRQIPNMHWRVLVALNDGPMHVSDLAKIALEKQPTMSKVLDRMEKLGLVARQPGLVDRRSTLVVITTEGRRLVRPLIRLARKHEEQVLAPLGEEHARVLVKVLRQLITLHAR